MPVLQQTFSESLKQLPMILEELSLDRLFLVLDETAYQLSGAQATLEPVLASRSFVKFTGFELNPKLEDVEHGITLYRNFQPQVVIALGGGTALDLGKLISALSVQKQPARSIALGQAPIQFAGNPLIAIPTTAGTGSEATHFAVVYVDGEKHSVADPSLLPAYAIVDSTLTESLPKHITAATGLDALCQAIESIWAVSANEESINYAFEAAQLAFENLSRATNAPTIQSRQAMCRASHLAGKAINITKTTAPHALSYYLTSRHGIPHGMAVACTLASLLKFNAGISDEDCADPRGAQAVRARIALILRIFSADNVNDACTAFEKLLVEVGCPTLCSLGVNNELILMVDSVNVERLSNNPRKATRNQLITLLSDCIAVEEQRFFNLARRRET